MTRTRRPAPAVLAGLLAAVLLCLLAACGDGAGDGKPAATEDVDLDVTVQDWNGWSRDQPKPTSRTESVGEGDSFEVKVLTGELTITVMAIDDEEITIETSRAMSEKRDGGGIDVRADDAEFTFDRDGEISLSTPTMDAGTTVTLAEK